MALPFILLFLEYLANKEQQHVQTKEGAYPNQCCHCTGYGISSTSQEQTSQIIDYHQCYMKTLTDDTSN